MFQHVYELLVHLTDDSDNNLMDDLDDEYRARFTEFLTLLIQNYFQVIDASFELPAGRFLELIYKFTFSQPNVYAYRENLAIWTHVLEFLERKHEANGLATVDKYKQGILLFSGVMIERMEYSRSSSFLSEIEDSFENTQGQTDYDMYLDECMLIIGKAVHLFPSEILTTLWQSFGQFATMFSTQTRNVRANRSIEEATILVNTFKDLRTMIRIMGHMAEVLLAHFDEYCNATYELLGNFLNVIESYMVAYGAYSEYPDYAKLCAEAFGVFTSYTHWLTQFHQRSVQQPQLMAKFDALCGNILGACFAVFAHSEISSRVLLAASVVYRAVCVTIRPVDFFNYAGVGDFLNNIHARAFELENEVKSNVYVGSSLALLLLIPHGLNETTEEFEQFVSGVTA